MISRKRGLLEVLRQEGVDYIFGNHILRLDRRLRAPGVDPQQPRLAR